MSTPTPPPPAGMPPATPPMGPDRTMMLSKVKGPAIALMVVSGLTLLFEVIGLLKRLIMGSTPQDWSQLESIDGAEQFVGIMKRMTEVTEGPAGLFVTLFFIVIVAVIFFGALKMKDLQSYGLAMTAAILSLVPCFSICCLGIPFGIWALVVLLNKDVKNAFV